MFSKKSETDRAGVFFLFSCSFLPVVDSSSLSSVRDSSRRKGMEGKGEEGKGGPRARSDISPSLCLSVPSVYRRTACCSCCTQPYMLVSRDTRLF
ncbi:hypothetical protein GGR56DRAFT_641380 [Xylariaceae sp. FL0804]|nr:hypothetical protein GGR56DRAFT_641380 [Xylariaceae sp. FL0804]